jgi:hypothetical protein
MTHYKIYVMAWPSRFKWNGRGNKWRHNGLKRIRDLWSAVAFSHCHSNRPRIMTTLTIHRLLACDTTSSTSSRRILLFRWKPGVKLVFSQYSSQFDSVQTVHLATTNRTPRDNKPYTSRQSCRISGMGGHFTIEYRIKWHMDPGMDPVHVRKTYTICYM